MLWLFCFGTAHASLPFLTTWKTTSAGETITLPVIGVSINVDWGDGQTSAITNASSPIFHQYVTPGLHNVSILGDLSGFSFKSQRDETKLVNIADWGDGFFVDGSSVDMFANCVNLQVSAAPTNQPVFLPGATLEGMFKNTSFNSSLNWNLTRVVSVARMFQYATKLNQPITFSNSDGVTNTSGMFYYATEFNQSV